MNHQTIEEHHVVDRYVMGRLPADEAARFEEHFFHCQDCQQALKLAERMQRGFKTAAAQEIQQVQAVQQAAWWTWIQRHRGAAGALMMLALVAVPGSMMWQRMGDLDRQLGSTQAALTAQRLDAERRSDVETTPSSAVDPDPAANPSAPSGDANSTADTADVQQLRDRVTAYEQQLDAERRQVAELGASLNASRQPVGNTQVLYLGAQRSADTASPPHRLRLPPEPTWIVLALEIEPSGVDSYTAVLFGPEGTALWSGEALQLDAQDTLNVSLHSSTLEPGDYRLEVKAVGAAASTPDKALPFTEFALRVE